MDINAGEKGPRTKNIPRWRLWGLVCNELANKLHFQQTQLNLKPTASQQELRLLLSGEIRNAIDELYVGRSQYQAGGLVDSRAREMQPYKLVAGLGPRRLCTYGRLSRSIA